MKAELQDLKNSQPVNTVKTEKYSHKRLMWVWPSHRRLVWISHLNRSKELFSKNMEECNLEFIEVATPITDPEWIDMETE